MLVRAFRFAAVFAVLMLGLGRLAPLDQVQASPAKPLTPEQLVRLKAAVKSLGEVTAIATSQTQRSGQAPAVFRKVITNFIQDPNPTKPEPSEIGKVADANDCQKTIVYPEDQPPLEVGDSKIFKFSVEISGAGCPLRYSAALTGVQHPDGVTATIKYSYAAISQEALDAADVDRTDLQGVIEGRSSELADGTKVMKFKMDFGGTAHSQKEGAFSMKNVLDGGFNIKMEEDPSGGFPTIDISGGMAELMGFTFKDMGAEVESKTTLSGFAQTVEYRLNGVVVTEAEYKDIRDAIQLPAFETADPNEEAAPYSLNCETRVYRGDAPGLSASEIQKQLDRGAMPATAGLTSEVACSIEPGINSMQSSFGTQTADSIFDYSDATFAKVSVRVCDSGKGTCSAAERFFLPGETKGYADTAGDYTVVTFCEAVPACAP